MAGIFGVFGRQKRLMTEYGGAATNFYALYCGNVHSRAPFVHSSFCRNPLSLSRLL